MAEYLKKYSIHFPSSAKADSEYYSFWQSLDGLTVEDMNFLISKRRRDMRYDCDIKRLRTEIAILCDAIKIARRQNELEEDYANI